MTLPSSNHKTDFGLPVVHPFSALAHLATAAFAFVRSILAIERKFTVGDGGDDIDVSHVVGNFGCVSIDHVAAWRTDDEMVKE